jgi:signal transduction histidine kinase
VFVGLENGLGALRRQGPGWVDEGLLAAIPGDVQSLLEGPDGRLWAGTAKNGLWRVSMPGSGPLSPGACRAEHLTSDVAATADCRLFEWNGVPALVASGTLFTRSGERFLPFPGFPKTWETSRKVELALPDGRGGLWLEGAETAQESFEEGLLRPDEQGAFSWKPLPRPGDFTTVANVLHVDEDGTIWVGHFQGLHRQDPAASVPFAEPGTLVRRVSTLKGDLIFGGSTQVHGTDSGSADLPFGHGGLRFEFAAPGFPQTSGVTFRVKLEGNDADWSPWITEPYRDYTNLAEGRYVFRVQARDGEGHDSREGSFRLRIRPPWHRTGWFRLAMLALIGIGAYGIHVLKTRLLRRRNQELETRIERATRDLRDRESQLTSQAQDLRSANLELKDLNEQKNTFLGVVAHDLKGPLHGIVLAAETLERDPREATQKRGRAIRKEGTEMCALIDRFLSVAAMESGELTSHLEVLDLASLVGLVAGARRAKAAEKAIDVFLQGADGPLWVLGDRVYVREILDNLLTNALKFSPSGTQVILRMEAREGWGCVSVADQGPGLTDLDKRRLFGRFTRLSARPTGGESSSGLGLFIVKRMVDDLGGHISVESEPGHGATFRVEFPRSTQPVAPPHEGDN